MGAQVALLKLSLLVSVKVFLSFETTTREGAAPLWYLVAMVALTCGGITQECISKNSEGW